MDGSMITLGWIIGSIASSTSIIMMNKFIMDEYHFNSPIFLTAYHFLVTWSVLELMCRMKLFDRATSFPLVPRLVLAGSSVGAVVFMNFNLKLNSVGFYQLSKLLVIPTIVVYSFFFEKKSTPVPILCSLGILLVGIALFTVNDVQVNLLGSVIAVFAVTFVAISQSKTGSVQKAYSINGPSAQHATAFQQFLLTLVTAVLMETHGSGNIFTHDFVQKEAIIALLTGLVSVSVNACAFGLIGKTSAVTYQVVGHCKTILIFVFGLVMFPPKQNETAAQFWKKIAGLVISMSGMILYTYLKLKGDAEATVKKGDGQPLLPQEGELPNGDEGDA